MSESNGSVASVVSEAKVAANRENARGSTGPTSDAGKAKSSGNALKYGMYSRKNVLPWEDSADYDAHVSRVITEQAPADEIEVGLVKHLADLLWKQARLERIEPLVSWQATISFRTNIRDPEVDKIYMEQGHEVIFAAMLATGGKEMKPLWDQQAKVARMISRALTDLAKYRKIEKQTHADEPVVETKSNDEACTVCHPTESTESGETNPPRAAVSVKQTHGAGNTLARPMINNATSGKQTHGSPARIEEVLRKVVEFAVPKVA